MRQLQALAVATALGVVIAGCGGDDEEKSNRDRAYTPPTSGQKAPAGAATEQDATAKTQARELVTGVEACFVDQQTYEACTEPEGVDVPLGSKPGQAEVADAGVATYTVVARSESGTSFEATKDEGGELKRSCDKPGTGGCPAGGRW
jgi:hypothetical protein